MIMTKDYKTEIEDLIEFYKTKPTGSFVTLYMIFNKKENGDLLITRSINELNVGHDTSMIADMMKELQRQCKENNINLIDARKQTNN